MSTADNNTLARRLGTTDAVLIGLGSMLGAGVFAAFAPAARAAGTGLLIGLVIAAVIAYCNAMASAQLAARYPVSGGTYIYGRERLGHWWGFTAGWGFVVGKTASCAAMALTVASYAVPGPWWAQRLIAVAAVLALTGLNYRGVTRTALLTRILVVCTLVVLAAVVIGIAVRSGIHPTHLGGWSGAGAWSGSGISGVLQAAGLLFFAFAGYARIATMGEEVRDPGRTIPRAIPIALGIAVVIYLLVALSALLAAGPQQLATASAPLSTAVQAAGVGDLAPVVRVGGALASLGALLALIAGIGRTGLAMARHGDLPRWLSGIHSRYRVPHRAELVLAVLVSALVLTTDLRGVIGFSSFGVLIYYAIANASAFTQPQADRRCPRALNVLGVAGCLVLVATLPSASVVAGLAVFAVGLAGRLVLRGLPRRRAGRPWWPVARVVAPRVAGRCPRLERMAAEHVIVVSTTNSEEAARSLAAGAVEANLGACAQVVGPITSVYRWEGAVQNDTEWRVEIKTAADRVAALVEHIKANHSYDVPEIVATPITGGSAEYLKWVVDETRG